MPRPSMHFLAPALAALAAGCASRSGTVAGGEPAGAGAVHASETPGTRRALMLQSAAMSMCDEWNAALGQACASLESGPGVDLRQRAAAQAMLRNGFGAALDIAAGPNPAVAMVDILVLCSLQTWSIGANWAGHGIGLEQGRSVADRLAHVRDELWSRAAAHLPAAELARLRSLIGEWIARHPDQQLVSFVRLADFAGERNRLTLADREAAGGILRELDDVTAAVDDARLLGERALWFASRYPYAVGQQAEFTTYRVAATMSDEFRQQRDELFRQVTSEREAIVRAIEQESKSLQPTLVEARETIKEARALSMELVKIVDAVDGLVARFDHDGSTGGITVEDLDRLLRHGGESAAEARKLIEAGGALASSDRWPAAAAASHGYLESLLDRLLLGGAAIVVLLIAGIALVRRLPPAR